MTVETSLTRAVRCPRDGSRLLQTVLEHVIVSECPRCGYEAKDTNAAQRVAFVEALRTRERLRR